MRRIDEARATPLVPFSDSMGRNSSRITEIARTESRSPKGDRPHSIRDMQVGLQIRFKRSEFGAGCHKEGWEGPKNTSNLVCFVAVTGGGDGL